MTIDSTAVSRARRDDRAGGCRPIDIVVPVYRGEAETRTCIESVLNSSGTVPREVVVIDDCSPEPALSAWLDALARDGRITLLRNACNRGFVGSVNRGMALHPDRDVVLLNSDTEVSGDWLDRLAAAAARHADAATLTPFSNNATICSYPYEGWTGEVPGTLGLAALDALFARTLGGVALDLPTGVGFCMFVRRAALDALGAFDEEAFGRGYGEENDFCRRAAKGGWRNLLCADVFVHHHGGLSFGSDRLALMRAGGRALLARHPEYDEVVRAFITADPFAPLRAAIDGVRAAQGGAEAQAVANEQCMRPAPGPGTAGVVVRDFVGIRHEDFLVPALGVPPARGARPVVLHVSHGWGGGVERWVGDYVAADTVCWNLLLRSRSGRNEAGVRLELVDPAADEAVLLAWELEEAIGACAVSHVQYRRVLGEIVSGFAVRAVIVSSLIGHALDVLDLDVPTVLVLHDLFPFCPALFGCFEGECRRCDTDDLARCLSGNPLNVFWHQGPAARWQALRAAFAARLQGGRIAIAAPSRSVAQRYAALFAPLGGQPVHVVAHGLGVIPAPLGPRRDVASRSPVRLRVLVPGRLSPHKGLALMARVLPALHDVAEVLLLGCGDFGEAFGALPHVQCVRDYAPGQLAGHVAAFAPDCALLASVLPETFSYTLSEMQALGVPVVATALGAFAERLPRPEEGGVLVAPSAEAIEARLRSLASDRETLLRIAEALRARTMRSAAEMVADYQALLGVGAGGEWAGAAPAMLRTAMDGVRDLRRAVRRCARELESSREALAAAQARLAALEQDLDRERASHRRSVTALQQEANAVRAEREALLNSSSWRLTAPLRRLVTAWRGKTGADGGADRSALQSPRSRPELVYRQGDPVSARLARRVCASLNCDLVALAGDAFDARFGMAALLGSAGGPLGSGDLPLAGDWEGDWAALCAPSASAARTTLRTQQRIAIGVPDDARLVVGMGCADGRDGLLAFARTAMTVAERSNGCVFVWIGSRDEAWMAAHRLDLGVPVSLRRLFLVEADVFEPWLLAADVYLGCREAPKADFGALEALACGVRVVVDDGATVPALVPGGAPPCRRDDGLSSADALIARLAAPAGPDYAMARSVRECIDGGGRLAALARSLEHGDRE